MGRRARVAFIGHSYVESSARRKLVYLGNRVDLRLISPSHYPTPFGRIEADFDFNQEVPVTTYPIRFANSKTTSTRWLLKSWDLGFREFQPDLIHIDNEQHSWIACQALLYRRLYVPRAKTVVFTWDNLRIREQGRKAWVLEQLARWNRRDIDFILCGNSDGREILIEKGYPEHRVEAIPQFGIDEDIFFPYASELRSFVRTSLGIQETDFAIGFVGRFVAEKGVLDLVDACGWLQTGGKWKRQPVLVMAGTGPLEEAIRVRCSTNAIRLIVLPPRKNHEIVETMNALDVLALPSQGRSFWKEQFGRVLIEAMACAVPVVGSDSGEIPHVIGDVEQVFHEGKSGELSARLARLLGDEGCRLAAGQRGRQRVLSNYTNRRIADRTLAIYDCLLREMKPGPTEPAKDEMSIAR